MQSVVRRFKGYPLAVALALSTAPICVAAEPTVEEVVKNCYYKYAGDDQRSVMTAILRDQNGDEQNYEFVRVWKDYSGEGDLVDKVVIYTLKPLSQRDIAFMRWGYTLDSGKEAEQWVYLPETRMVRRLVKRDPEKNGDWGLNDEELRIRGYEEDEHTYLGVKVFEQKQFYVVESQPKSSDPEYSKLVYWYRKTDDWDSCVEGRRDYYDNQGLLAKSQFTKWDKIGDAWIWRSAVVKNAKTNTTVVYKMRDVEVNVGLDDSDFSKRSLKLGHRR